MSDDWTGYRRTDLPAGSVPFRPYILSPHAAGWLIEDVWPTVYFGGDRLPTMRRKVAGLAWARELLAVMRREAELALAAPAQLPAEPCGWRHDFFSRRTAAHLLHEPECGGPFLDPTTGARERDGAQRRAWALLTHERTYRMMRSLGFLWRLTGDDRYARWVADGLRQAADYFTHAEFQREGALYYHPLYDAAVVLLLASAYELVRTSDVLDEADHRCIRARIFEDRVPSLVGLLDRSGAHNIACYAAAAVASAGHLLAEPRWLERGISGRAGLYAQLQHGIPTAGERLDGLWGEGTVFYHFYALCPLIALFELEGRVSGGVDSALRRRFRSLFEAPLALLDGELRLPALGDLGTPRTMHLAAYRHLYEYAAGRLDHERFAPVLAAIHEAIAAPRTDLAALAFGPASLPEPQEPPPAHSALPVAGIHVFRSEEPQPAWLLFRGGRFAGGHDHPDRLSILLHARGEIVSPDLGEPGYALRDAHGDWYRSTLAHNTLFCDEADQRGTALLTVRHGTPPMARGSVSEGDVYYRRTVFFDPPFIVLVDEYEGAKPHRYGWAFHAFGELTVVSPALGEPRAALGMPPLPDDGAWASLSARQTGEAEAVEAVWQVSPRLALRLLSRSGAPFEVTAARSPGNPYPDDRGTLLFRGPGRSRCFITLLEVYGDAPTALALAVEPEGRLRATVADGADRVYPLPEDS